ncbi:MAG: sugar ABC transporter permease [Clostridiales bacterium]|nr:sugar ABC transporter permease [Clostridiales bacterium]
MNETKSPQLKPRRKTHFTSDDRWGYIFIAAAMIIFCVFTLYPVFNAIYTSFYDYKPFGSKFVGFKNYITTLKYSKFNLFYKAAWNTLVYTAVVVPLSLLISFSVAIMILPFKKKTQSVFKAMYYLPGIASGVALSVVWLWLYDSSPDGLFNQLLGFFGIPAQNWLSSTKTSMLSLMIMALLSSHGTQIITYIAALLSIDNSYFEAAELDGATFFQKVRFIVWQLVKPTTLFLLVTGVIGSFQVFMNAYMMTGGGPDNSTTMIGLLIYNNAFEYGKYGLACAQAILLAIVIAVMSLFQFKMMGVDVEY